MFFDLDGTLCDTDEANYEAYAKAFNDEGYTISESDFWEYARGTHADFFIAKLAPNISTEAIARLRKRKAEYYPQLMHLIRPHKELISFLRVIAPLHETVLVTTASRQNAIHVLAASNISSLFKYKVFGDDVTNPKPHAEAYEKALQLTGLSSDEVIAFEDSQAGIDAATAASIKVIKVAISHEI